MENQEIQKLLDEALADKEFVARLETITSAEEAQKAFAEKGINLTLEEVQKIGDVLTNGDEISEADLENVAGGYHPYLIIGGIVVGTILLGLALRGIRILWGKLTG